MKSYTLDTNALLRYLLHDIPAQSNKVKNLFIQAKSAKIKLIIPQIVIFEIVFALDKFYALDKKAIILNLKALLGVKYLQVQDQEVFSEAIKLFEKYSLDFVDCFLAGLSKSNNSKLFTFDKDLTKKLGESVVKD